MKTVKLNLGGKTMDVVQLEHKILEEPWSIYKLEDGNVIKVKLVITGIYRLPSTDPVTGLPQFVVSSSNVMAVEPPESAKNEVQ